MTKVNRGDLLKLDAYRSLELEGAFAPYRYDFLLSNLVYLMALYLTSKGVEYKEIESSICEGGLRMKKRPRKSVKEVLEERSQQTRESFNAFADFALKCMEKRKANIKDAKNERTNNRRR